MGLSLTDSLPTDDYGKEITNSGPDKGGGCGWCGFLQAGTFERLSHKQFVKSSVTANPGRAGPSPLE